MADEQIELREAAWRNAVHIYRGSFNRQPSRTYDEDLATVKAIVAATRTPATGDIPEEDGLIEVMRDRLDRVNMLGEWLQKNRPDDEALMLIAADLRDCANGETIAACAEEMSRLTGRRAATPTTTRDMLGEPSEGWQPIETAPKDGSEVLVCWADIPRMAVAEWDADYAALDFAEGVGWRDGSDYGCGGMIGAMPTHWMPLPDPPEATAPRTPDTSAAPAVADRR